MSGACIRPSRYSYLLPYNKIHYSELESHFFTLNCRRIYVYRTSVYKLASPGSFANFITIIVLYIIFFSFFLNFAINSVSVLVSVSVSVSNRLYVFVYSASFQSTCRAAEVIQKYPILSISLIFDGAETVSESDPFPRPSLVRGLDRGCVHGFVLGHISVRIRVLIGVCIHASVFIYVRGRVRLCFHVRAHGRS